MKSILKNTDSTEFNKKEGSRTALLSSSVFVTCFWVQWSLAAKPSAADGRKKQFITIRIRRKTQTNCEDCLGYFLPYSGCMKKVLLECCYVMFIHHLCSVYFKCTVLHFVGIVWKIERNNILSDWYSQTIFIFTIILQYLI